MGECVYYSHNEIVNGCVCYKYVPFGKCLEKLSKYHILVLPLSGLQNNTPIYLKRFKAYFKVSPSIKIPTYENLS